MPFNPPDLSKSNTQEAYVHNAHNADELLQKEMDVNQAEQELLTHRIQIAKSLLNELPEFDPQHSSLRMQIKMDEIELDELRQREDLIADQLLGKSKAYQSRRV